LIIYIIILALRNDAHYDSASILVYVKDTVGRLLSHFMSEILIFKKMDTSTTIDKLKKAAEEKGFTLYNKNNLRSKTTYTCSKRKQGCSYQCFVENGMVLR